VVAMISIGTRGASAPGASARATLLLCLLAHACAPAGTHGSSQTDPTSASTGGLFAPAEGLWTLALGAELERTCAGDEARGFFPDNPYELVNVAPGAFTLAYAEHPDDPIHTCARTDAAFECPLVMIVGTCTATWEAGFAGEFDDPTHLTGTATLRYSCWTLPGGTDTGAGTGSSGAGSSGAGDCCDPLAGPNPCTVTHALTGVWTAA